MLSFFERINQYILTKYIDDLEKEWVDDWLEYFQRIFRENEDEPKQHFIPRDRSNSPFVYQD